MLSTPWVSPKKNQAGIGADVIAHFQNQLRSLGVGQTLELSQFCVGCVRALGGKQLHRVLGNGGCVDRHARRLERLDENGPRIV